jgi:hypothetical protein
MQYIQLEFDYKLISVAGTDFSYYSTVIKKNITYH